MLTRLVAKVVGLLLLIEVRLMAGYFYWMYHQWRSGERGHWKGFTERIIQENIGCKIRNTNLIEPASGAEHPRKSLQECKHSALFHATVFTVFKYNDPRNPDARSLFLPPGSRCQFWVASQCFYVVCKSFPMKTGTPCLKVRRPNAKLLK
jgi:hypothetical protein